MQPLSGQRARGAAIEARRAWRGDQRMGAHVERDPNVQRVAADQTAGRMHQHAVADRVTLGIQALEQAQRAFMLMAHDAAPALRR
ncbi:hypothetical protein Ddc_23339 [Ditylenchus destructor]|nr:hypothetical protein Ddc_23339 [Ditylenchus destructor]